MSKHVEVVQEKGFLDQMNSSREIDAAELSGAGAPIECFHGEHGNERIFVIMNIR